jgi:hypothetical protein
VKELKYGRFERTINVPAGLEVCFLGQNDLCAAPGSHDTHTDSTQSRSKT